MRYRERLLVPAWWWMFGAFLAFGMVLAVWTWWGDAWGAAAAVAFGGALVALMIGIGSPVVMVDERGISAGGALLEWGYVGQVTALDAEASARQLGVDAHPSAWLLTRPYIASAVRIDVDDAADPHPYWVISSRRPVSLLEAVDAQRQAVTS